MSHSAPTMWVGAEWYPRPALGVTQPWVASADWSARDTAEALHEVAHLVCGGDFDVECEGCGPVMAWEWAVARDAMPAAVRRAVVEYQRETTLSDCDTCRHLEAGTWKRPRESAWWRKGRAEAQRLGLLDARGCALYPQAPVRPVLGVGL